MRREERLEKEDTEENARRGEREYQTEIEEDEDEETQDKRTSSTTVLSLANQVGAILEG